MKLKRNPNEKGIVSVELPCYNVIRLRGSLMIWEGDKSMIEIPEAEVLAQQIKRTLTGKHIQKATANQSPHKFAWYSGDPAEYNTHLADKTITGARAFANFVQINADELRLVLSTSLRYLAAGEKPPAKPPEKKPIEIDE